MLREAGAIAPAMLRPLTPHEQIFDTFGHYLREERGLATKSIVHHLPFIRLFLREVCPGGTSDLGKTRQADVTRYIERHARDWSAASGKAMCWALGRRDYAILMMLAELGLRADEVATLTLDDIDWRSGEMLVRAKGLQRAQMPMPPDVGAAVVAYLRDGRPTSSCRRLFLRTLAPNVGFASGCAITMIWSAPASVATNTKEPISSDTSFPPSFSGPARPCRR